MSPLRIQLDRIRRRAWLVLTITLLAALAATAASLGQETTYTGRATLTIISQARAPEQDAPLAQGYAEYFNEEAYQEVLRQTTGTPGSVTMSARTAATSPIVYIEATAPSAELASSAAATMASAFLTDVNANLLADRESKIAELRNQITAERALLLTLPESSPEASLSANTVLSLQARMTEIQADSSSELQELQLHAGVSQLAPNPVQNISLGLVGGFVLGCVAALALAALENRIATAHDVRDQLNLDTLAEVPAGRSQAADRVRAQHLKRLANVVSLSDLGRPATIAITAPRATAGIARIAEALAYYRAIQGERTLHLIADLHQHSASWRSPEHQGAPGVADILADGLSGLGLEGRLLPGWCSTMQVLPAGNGWDDPYALFGQERFTPLVQHAMAAADLVVIEAPAIIEAAETQVICATANRTILVIEESATRVGDAVEARRLLEQVEATLLGVVIIGSPASRPATPVEHPEPADSAAADRAPGSLPPIITAAFEDGGHGVRR